MSNPGKAFSNTECDVCEEIIPEGEDVFFEDGSKMCESCADENGNVCPECGEYKKEEYPTCYECSH
jgi:hypothetical protein